jgi:Protein of unknown function (DUF3025)
LTSIDWSQPWLTPWRALGEPVARAVALGQPLHAALNDVGTVANTVAHPVADPVAHTSHMVRFVPQSALPAGTAYEDFIFRTQQCPVREGLHDFFNGLCWLRFPQTKRRLNQVQASQIAAHGIQTTRGAVRDAATVLDENGAFLDAPPALWQALIAKDWQALFTTHRPLWAQSHLTLFGHALLEKLTQPRKGIVAHVYGPNTLQNAYFSVANYDYCIADSDVFFSNNLQSEVLSTKPFHPMPILGVPGWWPANEEADFYKDPRVFRPPRISG